MIKYDSYNREERAICAHLFRLLHENLDKKRNSPLGKFLNYLSESNLIFRNGQPNLNDLKFENVSIYCEASIIRDAYHNRKPDVFQLMDSITKKVMEHEKISDCRLFSKLPDELNNYLNTHPKQIRQKAERLNIPLSQNEKIVYGAIQGMFNAKPDLVILIDNIMLVCEAKLTQDFDSIQIKRTWNISQVWAEVLYEDLGFTKPPVYTVFKLGANLFNPDINWTNCNEIAKSQYNENDRTRIAIQEGMNLLKNEKLE
ncbi:MAG: hypothetical protein JW833_08565 [Prolixibacteraceae bacterium]|nr:hypothetical protein [Prolixibacteraceae bacterium]